jgi:hypothetical protein
MNTCGRVTCPDRIRIDRPLMFDSLAWIMMVFLFALLAMVWNLLNNMQREQTKEWKDAAEQRVAIRADNLRQEQEIAAINLKLKTAPSDVMEQVQQIKSLLLENKTTIHNVCSPQQQAGNP